VRETRVELDGDDAPRDPGQLAGQPAAARAEIDDNVVRADSASRTSCSATLGQRKCWLRADG
jgi:hypothetical protein